LSQDVERAEELPRFYIEAIDVAAWRVVTYQHGAASYCQPHRWFRGVPDVKRLDNSAFSLKISTNPPERWHKGVGHCRSEQGGGTLSTSAPTAGTHTITATYLGDVNYASSKAAIS